jgi:23S rRNA (pseudouridine1915-N3)-methyltransferase
MALIKTLSSAILARMKLTILTVGHKPPAWVREASEDFSKRLPADWNLVWLDLKPAPRNNNQAAQWMLSEAQAIRQVLPTSTRIIVLDERGDDLSTVQFSERIKHWREEARDTAIVIGGPDGLDPQFKREAAERIRLSSLTLPHAFVRVLIAEQVYRAWSMLSGHPYHRQ